MSQRRIRVPDDLIPARDAALEQNWLIKPGGKHLRWYPPDGGRFIVTPTTTGKWRASRNARAALRRAGLNI